MRLRVTLSALIASTVLALWPARSAEAQLFVSDVGSNSIKEFSAANGSPLGHDALGVFASGGGLSVPFGLAFGPDNNLYVSSLGTGEILRYNGTSGAFIDKYVTKGSGGMNYPNEIAFGPDNNLYVASYAAGGHGSILEYQGPTGGSPGSFIKTFASNPGLQGPTGMQFNPFDGNLYVSSSTNNAIYAFDGTTGALLNGGPLISGAVSGLNGPAGLSFGPDGNLYVANFFPTTVGGKTSIVRYDLGSVPSHSDFTGSIDLNGPVVPVFNTDLKLYVSSYRNNSIYRFNALTGAFDSVFVGANYLSNPSYITFAPAAGGTGNLTVVPEPTSVALLSLGLAGIVGWSRFRRKR